jgi:hypothetical protein
MRNLFAPRRYLSMSAIGRKLNSVKIAVKIFTEFVTLQGNMLGMYESVCYSMTKINSMSVFFCVGVELGAGKSKWNN